MELHATKETYLDDPDWFGLTNSMTSIFRLQIVERIKVEIVQDANVCGSQVDA